MITTAKNKKTFSSTSGKKKQKQAALFHLTSRSTSRVDRPTLCSHDCINEKKCFSTKFGYIANFTTQLNKSDFVSNK